MLSTARAGVEGRTGSESHFLMFTNRAVIYGHDITVLVTATAEGTPKNLRLIPIHSRVGIVA